MGGHDRISFVVGGVAVFLMVLRCKFIRMWDEMYHLKGRDDKGKHAV